MSEHTEHTTGQTEPDGPDTADHAQGAETLTIAYDGSPGPIAGIQIKNLLLMLPTLGVYRFWATTRLRRYFWSSLRFNDSRLEYTGRGMELFLGLLLVLLVLVPLVVVFAFLFNFLLFRSAVLAYTLYFLFFVGLTYLSYAGSYLRYRYIMSRTRWRGIRFALAGSPWKFAVYGLGQLALVLITFSIYTPYATMNLTGRVYQNAFFGNRPIGFEQVTDGLMWRYLLIFGSYFIGYIIFIALIVLMGIFATEHPILIGIISFVFFILWWGSFFWFIAVYQGWVYRSIVSSLRFDKLHFKSDYTGAYLFKAYLIACLIIIPVVIVTFAVAGSFTYSGLVSFFIFDGPSYMDLIEIFTLFLPFLLAGLVSYLAVLFVVPVVIQHRLFRDLVSTMTITGTFNPQLIAQADQEIDGRGEGLATALDVGGF